MGNLTKMRPGTQLGLLLPLAALLTSQGCAIRSNATTWKPAPLPARVVDVFYATDRDLLPPAAKPCPGDGERPRPPRFGIERSPGEMAFGLFPVRLPAQHRLNQIIDFQKRPDCFSPEHALYFRGPAAQDREAFFQAVADALASAPRQELLVYVHGYNFKFDEAVLWAAQLQSDTDFRGVQILYSWPSRGSRWSYVTDSGNAEWATPHLKEFLDQLAARVPQARIHLLAHSLGNRPLLLGLNRLATERRDRPAPKFGQIILAAPDIDQDIFRQLIGPVLTLADRVTLYTSAKDSALGASGWLFSYPRAGDSEYGLVQVAGMDTVDVSAVDQGGSRHNYFLDNPRVLADLFQLLRFGSPPDERFGLWRVPLESGPVWQFKP